jgi:D-alanyl-D-alanine carboxypeptidase (penicillin-binding protein 5/6)
VGEAFLLVKRILLISLAVIFMMQWTACLADVEFTVAAKAAVLIEAESGRVLFAQNADEMLPMASTTKIMTCLLALENSVLDEKVTAGPNAHGVSGTSIYLSEGETLTMEQMLYGLMLRSGNDAAVAVAEHIAGSVKDFAAMMNERAEELGADANFVNPHGLPAEGHKASALGMALIMREAMKNSDFARITSTKEKIIPWEGNEYSRHLQNKNRLLTSYEGATGGKTGYTAAAGRCLVFSAKRDDMSLIGCVLNCSSWFDTAEAMLDYGFENYSMLTAYEKGESAGEIAVTGGQKRRVALRFERDMRFPVNENEPYEIFFEIPESVAAPVAAGDRAGRALARSDGVLLCETPLIYADTVHKRGMEAAFERVIDGWLLVMR